MTKNKWLLVAIGAGLVFVVAALNLLADNKLEVIAMVVSGGVGLFAANASGKAKIKEFNLRQPIRR